MLGLNYYNNADPVLYGEVNASLAGATSLQRHDDWLLASGVRKGVEWNIAEPCAYLRPSLTVAAVTAGGEHDDNVDAVTLVNLFDPVLTLRYDFDAYIADSVIYGDYLIVALGDQGIEIRDRDRPEIRTRLSFDGILANPGEVTRLRLLGSSLILSAGAGGMILLDLADPLNPEIISAGNRENILAADVFKDRLVAASGNPSITVMQLTDSLVTGASVAEGALLADAEPLILTFNEPIVVASLLQPDAVTLVRADTGETVTFTLSALDAQNDAGAGAGSFRSGVGQDSACHNIC